ncbi:MAG TPA: dephospho-CoA kinase [Rhodoblastus sp.]|nr:dephospho-CoA kinase [Rhodoblastus sp.]
MIVLGLTGSIGMGKSTTASMFRALGVPVYDSDRGVHEIYESKAPPEIERRFPEAIADGRIDRKRLGDLAFHHPEALKALEAVIHPIIKDKIDAFLASAAKAQKPIALLDVPLLFETDFWQRTDVRIVVSAPADVQKERVLARPQMDEAKLERILARQTADREKRARAHFVVETHFGLDHARRQVETIVKALLAFDR